MIHPLRFQLWLFPTNITRLSVEQMVGLQKKNKIENGSKKKTVLSKKLQKMIDAEEQYAQAEASDDGERICSESTTS